MLGELPDWIQDEYAVTWVLEDGKYPPGYVEPADLQTRIEILAESEEARFPVQKWRWYVTIVIERTIDLDEQYLRGNKYRWIDYHESVRIASVYR